MGELGGIMIYTAKQTQKQLLEIFESMEKDINVLFDSFDKLRTDITLEKLDSFLDYLYFFQGLVILQCRLQGYVDPNLPDTIASLKAKYPEKFRELPDFGFWREMVKMDERNSIVLSDSILGLESQMKKSAVRIIIFSPHFNQTILKKVRRLK